MSTSFSDLATPGVQGLKPYQPGKPIAELEREYGVSNIIKLASNENPLGPSARVLEAIGASLHDLQLYPDANGFELKQRLAELHRVEPECITLGNGSNDVLVLLAETFLRPDSEAIYSQYCFAVYPIAVQAVGAVARVADAHPPDHDMPYGHDLAAMADLISDQTRLIYIANPNNPTGTWLTEDALRDFVDRVPEHVVVVVDEAYFEYAEVDRYPNASLWLNEYPNLVITRTFSKAYGLAGLRVGYSVSHPQVAGLLNRVRQPFNVNTLAQVAACAALEDRHHLIKSREANLAGIRQVQAGCEQLGLSWVPSAGNFLLVDLHRSAGEVFEGLLRRGVITRPVDNYGLPNHLRITMGTAAENERLITALGEVLSDA